MKLVIFKMDRQKKKKKPPMSLFHKSQIHLDEEKKAEKPKEPEGPPPDPAVASVIANKESIIEINTNNKGLGLFVVGGKMHSQTPVVSWNFNLRFRFVLS